MSQLRLRPGDRLGSQSVQRWLCTDALGERYETIFGSTTHSLDVSVPPAGAESPTAAEYRDFAERVSAVRHPCVVRYLAAGESAPRPGAAPVPWLRSEHREGAAASILETPVDPAGLPADEDGPRVPDLAALLAACGDRLAPADRDALLGDVLAGLAHLHSLGIACGHLAPDEISLGHVRHRASPRARIRLYGGLEDAAPADLAADLVLAAPLFRAALDASQSVSKPRETEELAAFADRLGAGGFETAAAAAAAFDELRAKWGRPRLPENDGDDDGGEAPATAGRAGRGRPDGPDAARGRARRHHAPSSSGSSEVARRLMALVRIFGVIAFIVGVGVAVYFYLSSAAEEERRRLAAAAGNTLPAILVIPTERPAEDRLAELPASVFAYDGAQLELAAAAEGDPRAVLATARLALEGLDDAETPDEAAFDEAAARIAPVLPALRKAALSDPAAGLLLGRAALLGLGTPRDVDEGARLVVQATLDGLDEAYLVYGDLLASDVPVRDLRAESRVERDRRAVAAWRRAAGPDAAPGPCLRRAADRIAPMLRSGRGIPPVNNDYPQWLGRIAAAGHVPALRALATPGGFASDDPAEALKWLRVLARTPAAPPELRAWAQFRMSRMFERGEGTPPSASAARKWLERAAEGGNGDAMLALADKLKKGTHEDRVAAAGWRKRAKSAPPLPPFELRTALVEPPPAVAGRFPAAAPAETRPPDDLSGPDRANRPAAAANRAAARPAPETAPRRTKSAGEAPLVRLTDEPPPAPAGTPKKESAK